MKQYAGRALLGTSDMPPAKDDRTRSRSSSIICKSTVVQLQFNGQLAEYRELPGRLLADEIIMARENDTEIIMHEIGASCRDGQPELIDVFRNIARRFDGAYNLYS